MDKFLKEGFDAFEILSGVVVNRISELSKKQRIDFEKMGRFKFYKNFYTKLNLYAFCCADNDYEV